MPPVTPAAPAVVPTIGRLVLYKLSGVDAEAINKRRGDYHAGKVDSSTKWPAGAQAHVGNHAVQGNVFPMLVVSILTGEPNILNGQVFLDGTDTLWVTSVHKGEGTGCWDWMPFQKDQQARMAPGTLPPPGEGGMGVSMPSGVPTGTPSGNQIGATPVA